jgi:hypothetical protein
MLGVGCPTVATNVSHIPEGGDYEEQNYPLITNVKPKHRRSYQH